MGWIERARQRRIKGTMAAFKALSRNETNSQRAYYGP
jgi:hypothetical protein